MEVLIMNRKCCFYNMNTNNEDNELLRDWMEFRFEKSENNLTDEDKNDIFMKEFFIILHSKILLCF